MNVNFASFDNSVKEHLIVTVTKYLLKKKTKRAKYINNLIFNLKNSNQNLICKLNSTKKIKRQ